jgi:hypothetical protein
VAKIKPDAARDRHLAHRQRGWQSPHHLPTVPASSVSHAAIVRACNERFVEVADDELAFALRECA